MMIQAGILPRYDRDLDARNLIKDLRNAHINELHNSLNSFFLNFKEGGGHTDYFGSKVTKCVGKLATVQ